MLRCIVRGRCVKEKGGRMRGREGGSGEGEEGEGGHWRPDPASCNTNIQLHLIFLCTFLSELHWQFELST